MHIDKEAMQQTLGWLTLRKDYAKPARRNLVMRAMELLTNNCVVG
jgi:hypothetical protein